MRHITVRFLKKIKNKSEKWPMGKGGREAHVPQKGKIRFTADFSSEMMEYSRQ